MLTALQYLISIHSYGGGGFWSKENPTRPASNSELRRWIQASAFHINGHPVTMDEVIDYPLNAVVLFPKNQAKRITLL